jgi:hypothetical protein
LTIRKAVVPAVVNQIYRDERDRPTQYAMTSSTARKRAMSCGEGRGGEMTVRLGVYGRRCMMKPCRTHNDVKK